MKVLATDAGALSSTTMGYADLMKIEPAGSRESFIGELREIFRKNIAAFREHPEAWAEKRFEQVRRVAVLPRDLTIEDGELSPTLKIKRRVVEKRYATPIGRLYAEETAHA